MTDYHHPRGPSEQGNAVLWQADELAACLRRAVTAMEALVGLAGSQGLLSTFPGLPDLIERSKAALKEYGK